MVRPPANSDDHPRFHASVRHYHRAGPKGPIEWDQWVEGTNKPAKKSKSSRKILMSLLTVLMLVGGLFIWMLLSTQ